METPVDVKTPPSRHYFYRKATDQSTDQANNHNNVKLNNVESTNVFEKRINDFINKSSMQSALEKMRSESTHDLNRRKADRRARKEREEQSTSHPASNHSSTGALESPTETKQQDTPLFEKLNALSPSEQNAWLVNTRDNALLVNPHQWLKLASLFNVNSKVARQHTLLNIASSESVLKDRSIGKEDVKPLENFLELRDIQNRNYARDAVAEGVKLFKQNRIKEAMEFYKRALDMDSKYADGWFHVAEGLVQQNKLTDAAEQLERTLKLDPTHEEAKALLASIRHTIKPNKPSKGDEWDLVDEFGESMEKTSKSKRRDESKDSDDESRSRKKKRRSTRRSRSRDADSSRRSDRDKDRDRNRDRGRDRERDRDRDRRDRDKHRDSDRDRRSNRSKDVDRDERSGRSRDDRGRRSGRSRDERRSDRSRDEHRGRRSDRSRDEIKDKVDEVDTNKEEVDTVEEVVEIDKEKDDDRPRDYDKEKSQDRDRGSERDRHRYSGRDRHRDRDSDRDRHRDKDRQRDRDRDDRDSRRRYRSRDRDSDRDSRRNHRSRDRRRSKSPTNDAQRSSSKTTTK